MAKTGFTQPGPTFPDEGDGDDDMDLEGLYGEEVRGCMVGCGRGFWMCEDFWLRRLLT